MSLEQSFSKKLTLGPGGSHQQLLDTSTTNIKAKSPSASTDSSPKSSPSKSAKLSLRGLGSSVVGSKRCRSPIRRQQTVGPGPSSAQESASVQLSHKRDKKSEDPGPGGSWGKSSKSHKGASTTSKSSNDLGEFIPGTSGTPGVDHSPFDPQHGKQSAANKIIHNWKSACGRTKDKTKDFIRRWKTLPENHPDFDKIARSPPGSSTNIAFGAVGGGGSSNTLSQGTGSVSVSLQTPNQQGTLSQNNAGESSGTIGTSMASSSASGMGKLKNLTKSKTDAEVPSSHASSSSTGQGAKGSSSGTGNFFVSNGPSQQQNKQQEDNSMQVDSVGGTKSSTGWSVHVWATYVQRGNDDVLFNEEAQPGREFLSEFQKIKLTHFFRHVLDMNHDDVISAEDFVALNQRIRHYIEWSSECIEFHILKEVHSGFLECFLNQPLDDSSGMYYCSAERETRQNVNIDEWLDVWGTLLNSARTMEALPLWLQYFPKILFQVINKSGSGTITKEQLRAFYTTFLGIDFRVVNDTLDSIYNAMTDGGRNKMTYGLFKLCFANFLLGKYPHGPGQYLFGICAPATLSCAFPIDYSALNTPKDDLEPYDPDKDKGQSNRRSVIV